MNRLLTAIAVLAVTVLLPSFPATVQAHETGTMSHKEMMRNPQHMLMMAYHNNVMTFGHKLYKVAKQGETVPRDFARTAVAEMKRSIDEMERYRASAMAGAPAGAQQSDMHKKMDQHLVSVKTHLRELEDLAKTEPVRSADVVKHLDEMWRECDEMVCGMMEGTWMHGRKGMHGCPGGCPCPDEMSSKESAQHHAAMQEMMQKMKRQDAELARQVQALKAADVDASKKLNLMSDLVATMVQQRADLTVDMERMQVGRSPHSFGYEAGGYTGQDDEED